MALAAMPRDRGSAAAFFLRRGFPSLLLGACLAVLGSAIVHHLVAGLACARTRYVQGNLPCSGACGLLVAVGISRHATLDWEICLTSGSDPRDLHLTAGRLVSLPDGKTHLVGTAPLTIGRGPSSDVAVHREDVSRSHACLLRTPQGFILVDSSLHGTYV